MPKQLASMCGNVCGARACECVHFKSEGVFCEEVQFCVSCVRLVYVCLPLQAGDAYVCASARVLGHMFMCVCMRVCSASHCSSAGRTVPRSKVTQHQKSAGSLSQQPACF